MRFSVNPLLSYLMPTPTQLSTSSTQPTDAYFDSVHEPRLLTHRSQEEISTVRSDAKSDSDFHPPLSTNNNHRTPHPIQLVTPCCTNYAT